ncbi:50S ribosomal protein L13 [candidate division KSB1 bacterium]|nr:50S ribosomal protein L13 [candidate division KSB1 bacterium]
MKTFTPKPGDIDHKWYVIDANGLVLGRLAAKIAQVLRGKHKPIWAPHMDCGDFIVVVNADKLRLTGRKMLQKRYVHHSGYPGGLRHTAITRVMQDKPEYVLRHAVRGMLPHNRLGRKMLKKLKIYTAPEHPHTAQKPETLNM